MPILTGLESALAAANERAWDELYASTPELVWGTQPIAFLPRFLPPGDELPPGDVLDAAGGEGRNLPALLRLGRPVTLCDASGAALAKIPAPLAAEVDTLLCSLDAIPLPDGRFSFILLSDTIETLPRPGPVLAELRRLLVPGGILLANIPDSNDGIAGRDMERIQGEGWLYRHRYFYRFYGRREAEGLLAQAGFEVGTFADCEWDEPPHPNFREAVHRHRSQVFVARRVD